MSTLRGSDAARRCDLDDVEAEPTHAHEDRDGAVFGMETTMRDLGDAGRSLT